MRRWRRMMRRGRAWFLRMLRIDDSSSRLALGAAVGIFIAMTPTIGLQMILVLLLLLIIPGNKLMGLPMVWITNPATAIPIYTFNYWLGAVLTGQERLCDITRHWRGVIENLPGLGSLFSSPGEWLGSFADWLWVLWGAMKDVFVPLWIGSLVTGLIAGGAAYIVFYCLIEFYRRKLRLIKLHLPNRASLRKLIPHHHHDKLADVQPPDEQTNKAASCSDEVNS